MKKRILSLLALVMAASMILSACGGDDGGTANTPNAGGNENPAADGTVYEIKYANVGAAGGVHDQSALKLEAELNRRSVEQLGYEAFDIILYPSGQLAASDAEQLDMVMQGIVQYSTCPPSTFYQVVTSCPEINVIDLPYLFPDHDSFYAFCESDIMKNMADQILAATGVRVGAGFIVGDTYFGTNGKEIHSPADLQGQKIRTLVSDIWVDTLAAYGGSPTPVAYSEVYTALQQGTVDGVMAASASYTDARFYEVVDSITQAGGLLTINYEIWNEAWIQSLPDDVRAILEETLADFALQNRRDTYADFNAEVDQTIIDAGVPLIKLSEEEEQKWKDIALPLYETFADLCGGMENIEKVQQFIADFEESNS